MHGIKTSEHVSLRSSGSPAKLEPETAGCVVRQLRQLGYGELNCPAIKCRTNLTISRCCDHDQHSTTVSLTHDRSSTSLHTKIALFLLLSSIVLALSGCGGSGKSSVGPIPNPYAGTYAGTFTTGKHDSGAIYLAVAGSGAITGKEIDTTAHEVIQVAGTVNFSGIASITTTAGTVHGALSLSAGVLTGSFVAINVSGLVFSAPTLKGALSFANSYGGTFSNSLNQSGRLTVIIDPEGNFTGLFGNTSGGGVYTGIGSITSSGQTFVTQSNFANQLSGTLAINALNQLSGTLSAKGLKVGITVAPN